MAPWPTDGAIVVRGNPPLAVHRELPTLLVRSLGQSASAILEGVLAHQVTTNTSLPYEAPGAANERPRGRPGDAIRLVEQRVNDEGPPWLRRTGTTQQAAISMFAARQAFEAATQPRLAIDPCYGDESARCDAGLIGSFLLYHQPLAATTAAVLVYHVIALWVPGLLGSISFVQLRRTLRRERRPAAVCSPLAEPIEAVLQLAGVVG